MLDDPHGPHEGGLTRVAERSRVVAALAAERGRVEEPEAGRIGERHVYLELRQRDGPATPDVRGQRRRAGGGVSVDERDVPGPLLYRRRGELRRLKVFEAAVAVGVVTGLVEYLLEIFEGAPGAHEQLHVLIVRAAILQGDGDLHRIAGNSDFEPRDEGLWRNVDLHGHAVLQLDGDRRKGDGEQRGDHCLRE